MNRRRNGTNFTGPAKAVPLEVGNRIGDRVASYTYREWTAELLTLMTIESGPVSTGGVGRPRPRPRTIAPLGRKCPKHPPTRRTPEAPTP